jgi:hypothetical protein
MVITDEVLSTHDLENTTHQLAFIHDELQYECLDDEQTINELTFTLAWAAVKAGEYYKLNILIDAEAKVGPDWAATH